MRACPRTGACARVCVCVCACVCALQRDAPALFKTLCDKYAPSLERDPAYEQYIQAIGLRYYKIQPPQSGLASLMSNMMGMFGGGMPPMGGGAGGSAAGALPPNPFAALMR
ncbi:DUF410 domain-containing protein [archaeon]|nr:MAG: DUF410 domain-containing protein [archaeon]